MNIMDISSYKLQKSLLFKIDSIFGSADRILPWWEFKSFSTRKSDTRPRIYREILGPNDRDMAKVC